MSLASVPNQAKSRQATAQGDFDPNKVLSAIQTESRKVGAHNQKASINDHKISNVQRDLDWLLSSSDMLDLKPYLSQCETELHIDCFQRPETRCLLETQHVSEQRRLGLYAEDLLSAYFSHPESSQILISRNLQIQNPGFNEGRTVGEFDFLTQDRRSKRYLHTEMCCKFYLGLAITEANNTEEKESATSSWQYWLGPNCNDRLDIKMSRLIERQLTLSEHPASKQRLMELAITPVDAQYLLRGRLFFPAYKAMAAPQHSSKDQLKGLWICHSEVEKFYEDMSKMWQDWWFTQLNKLEFMAARPSHCYQHPLLSKDRFKNYIDDYFRNGVQGKAKNQVKLARPLPLVLSPTTSQTANMGFTELRLFVVPDSWTELASKQAITPSPL
ncbi:DUF1853 family protein [uncultured Pseudoteredinibacter sp.]|uniref:DUF1853 family protein n=1 Tax=uncultured Pseudoteredinibacter sp. TaxID=1641701 RepID=UPI002608A31E|nr:DUF1853 family protein [uncultured Pseudoteredinibacter sp.]